jgi:hypothetical protein
MKGGMARLFRVVFIMLLVCIMTTTAMGAGMTMIPGSRDVEGTLGEDGKSWEYGFINTGKCEGATSDAYETTIVCTDPTSDNTIRWPDSSGTVSLTSGGLVGADTVGSAQIVDNTVSTADILNSTIGTLDIATGGVASVDILDNSVSSADILNSTITDQDILTNSVSIWMPAGSTTNTVTVNANDFYTGYFISTAGSYNGATITNAPLYVGSGVWRISMYNAPNPNPVEFKINFIRRQ